MVEYKAEKRDINHLEKGDVDDKFHTAIWQ